MLGEIAITPGVFWQGTHRKEDAAFAFLGSLKEVLLNEVIVRDLCGGKWSEVLTTPERLSPRGKELIKCLRENSRMRVQGEKLEQPPDNEIQWCREANASHAIDALDCVLTTHPTWAECKREPVVASVENLTSSPWWSNRSCSLRVRRSTDCYLAALDKVLSLSAGLSFIDPFLDPSRENYKDFYRLLQRLHRPGCPVRVEIHLKRPTKTDPDGRQLSCETLEKRFRDALLPALDGIAVKVSVFVWENFHDRYLISNLCGITMANGFDVDGGRTTTTWARLSRQHREEVTNEFSEAFRAEKPYKFDLVR